MAQISTLDLGNIEIDSKIDLTSATGVALRASPPSATEQPDGTFDPTYEYTATKHGTKTRVIVVAKTLNEFNLPGRWRFWGKYTFSATDVKYGRMGIVDVLSAS